MVVKFWKIVQKLNMNESFHHQPPRSGGWMKTVKLKSKNQT
jgi:hypothetical protein